MYVFVCLCEREREWKPKSDKKPYTMLTNMWMNLPLIIVYFGRLYQWRGFCLCFLAWDWTYVYIKIYMYVFRSRLFTVYCWILTSLPELSRLNSWQYINFHIFLFCFVSQFCLHLFFSFFDSVLEWRECVVSSWMRCS